MNDKAIHDAMVSIENRVIHIYNQGFSDGYEEGKSEAKLIETIDNMNRQYRSGYSKGLEEAWECARKLLFDSSLPRDILTELGADTFCGIIQNCSASEAIEKIKEYEEQKKQSEKSCDDCRFADLTAHEFPCSVCSASHTFRWEPWKGASE